MREEPENHHSQKQLWIETVAPGRSRGHLWIVFKDYCNERKQAPLPLFSHASAEFIAALQPFTQVVLRLKPGSNSSPTNAPSKIAVAHDDVILHAILPFCPVTIRQKG